MLHPFGNGSLGSNEINVAIKLIWQLEWDCFLIDKCKLQFHNSN